MSVIKLDDFRPHVLIMTADGVAHVLPVRLLTRIVNGDLPVSTLEDALWQQILQEWIWNVSEPI